MRPTRIRARLASLAATLMVAALLLPAAPVQAAPWDWEFEGSKAEDVLATGIDLVIVRPLASARVVVGFLFFLPAAALSAPSGREGFDGAYDLMIQEPVEYAFVREIGQF